MQSRREDFLKLTEARKAEEQRRRESMIGRGLTAQQHKEVAEQMEHAQHENEVSLLQSRREDFLRLTEARKAEEDRRRESMIGRGLTAQQHKEVKEQMEHAQHENEVSLLQSRRDDFLKLTEARKAEEDRRRESMVGRGITAQQHREVKEQMEQARHDETTDELQYRHYLREQKAESEKDEARRSRESLAGRLNTWRAHRSIEGPVPIKSNIPFKSLLFLLPLFFLCFFDYLFYLSFSKLPLRRLPHTSLPLLPSHLSSHQNNNKTRSTRRNEAYSIPGSQQRVDYCPPAPSQHIIPPSSQHIIPPSSQYIFPLPPNIPSHSLPTPLSVDMYLLLLPTTNPRIYHTRYSPSHTTTHGTDF